MKKIASFSKVSYEQFKKDMNDTMEEFECEQLEKLYNSIKLPKRATSGSAGYDFFSFLTFKLSPNQTIKFPTGITANISDGWVLMCYPRSGLGFKYRMQLDNTVGIIDSDYSRSDNEGHIFCKITNDTNKEKIIIIKEGDAYMQGVFVEYGITFDDDSIGIRNGGFGSTSS